MYRVVSLFMPMSCKICNSLWTVYATHVPFGYLSFLMSSGYKSANANDSKVCSSLWNVYATHVPFACLFYIFPLLLLNKNEGEGVRGEAGSGREA